MSKTVDEIKKESYDKLVSRAKMILSRLERVNRVGLVHARNRANNILASEIRKIEKVDFIIAFNLNEKKDLLLAIEKAESVLYRSVE